ncbi:MAG: hypothetical protein ACYC5N_02895 [Endomicrobiales bacterium]
MNARLVLIREKLEKQFSALENRIAGAAPAVRETPAVLRQEALRREKETLAGLLAQARTALEERSWEIARLTKKGEALAAEGEKAVSLLRRENRALMEKAEQQASENERLKEEVRFLRAETGSRQAMEDEKRERETLLDAKTGEIARLFARLREFENEREQLCGEIEMLKLRRHHRHRVRKEAPPPQAKILAWLGAPVIEIGTKSGR